MNPKTTYLLGAVGFCLLAASGCASAEAGPGAGKKIYQKWCSDCHSTQTGPGSLALARKYHGDPTAILEQRHDLTPGYVKLAVRHGVSFMPSFRKTEISDADLALLGAYLAPTQETKQP